MKKKLIEPESANYCIEPPSFSFYLKDQLYGLTCGILSNESNSEGIFYLYADDQNKEPLKILVRPLTDSLRYKRVLNPGEICFFPCDMNSFRSFTTLNFKIQIQKINLKNIKKPIRHSKASLFPSLNLRKVKWIRSRNLLDYAVALESIAKEAFLRLASIACRIKQVKGAANIKTIADDLTHLMEDKLPSLPFQLQMLHLWITPQGSLEIPSQAWRETTELSCSFQEVLPRHSLTAKNDKLCSFKFQGDEKMEDVPFYLLHDRIIFADAFSFAGPKDSVITLEGKSTDWQNRFLMAYLRTNQILIEPLSVNEIADLIALGEKLNMNDFIDKVIREYLHLSKGSDRVKKEPLELDHFKFLLRKKQHKTLNQLIRLGGYTHLQQWIDCIEFLLPLDLKGKLGAEDKKTRNACVKAFSETKEFSTLVEGLKWAKMSKRNNTHLLLCEKIYKTKRMISIHDYIQCVTKGSFHLSLCYIPKYSDSSTAFYDEFTDLLLAFENASVKLKGGLEAMIKKTIREYSSHLINVRNFSEMQFTEKLLFNLPPIFAFECVKTALGKNPFSEKDGKEIRDFIYLWAEHQNGPEPFNKFRRLLENLDFTNVMTLKGFVHFAGNYQNRTFNEKYVSDSKFRETIIDFNNK